MKPRLFIGSSVESLGVAYAIQQNLQRDAEVTVWSQGIFQLSRATLESLVDAVPKFDFAIFVFSPDDVISIRGETASTARDNVIFEFGLFTGAVGRDRCFVFTPLDSPELHLPTDLLGIGIGRYEAGRSDENLQAGTGPACHEVRRVMRALGRRAADVDAGPSSPSEGTSGDERGAESHEEAADAVATSEEQKLSVTLADYWAWRTPFDQGDFETARTQLLQQVERLEVGTEDWLVRKSWVAFCEFKSNPRAGIASLEALRAEHHDGYSSWRLADCYLEQGRVAEALSVALEWLSTSEDGPSSIGVAGMYVSCTRNLPTEAEVGAALHAGLVACPANALLRIGVANWQAEHVDAASAVRTLDEGLQMYPYEERLASRQAAIVAEGLGPAEALRLYDALILRHPNNADYVGLRGNQYVRLSLYSLAQRDYRAALEISAESGGWVLPNIGNVLTNVGLHHEAVATLEEAIRLQPPGSQYSHDRLASALQQSKAQEGRAEELSLGGRRRFLAILGGEG